MRLGATRAFACCAALALAAAPRLPAGAAATRNDYASAAFTAPLSAGLDRFYAGAFATAEADFDRALAVVPDNTLALSFRCAAAAQQPGALDAATNVAEDAVAEAPTYVNHVRLGFDYLFESLTGRDRLADAREEFDAALARDPAGPAAHVGLGIMRFNERSSNRAKTELLLALRTDPTNVLAREYLGSLYQSDLHDPQRALSYEIDVPNLVPRYADIAFHIGSLLADLHQNAAALGYLQRALALDSDHIGEAGQHGHTLMAKIYLDENRPADATRELDLAVAEGVDAIYARTLLEQIKNGASPAPSPGPSGTPK
jgi:tetratricopeptide (TPR) repeat protein